MKKLGFLDRFLTLWIFIAMLIGVFIGYLQPNLSQSMEGLSNGTTNIPLAVGLIIMMYPPLAKVNYKKIPAVFKNYKLVLLSLSITWILAPFFMFVLANLFLSDFPEYRTGLILIGIAPCIAMVIVWNELAGGNREYIAGLIGVNSLLQVFFYAGYAYFYLTFFPTIFGMKSLVIEIEMVQIAKTVFLFLGVPFLLGFFSRMIFIRLKGEEWYEQKFIPFISPMTLIAINVIGEINGINFCSYHSSPFSRIKIILLKKPNKNGTPRNKNTVLAICTISISITKLFIPKMVGKKVK